MTDKTCTAKTVTVPRKLAQSVVIARRQTFVKVTDSVDRVAKTLIAEIAACVCRTGPALHPYAPLIMTAGCKDAHIISLQA